MYHTAADALMSEQLHGVFTMADPHSLSPRRSLVAIDVMPGARVAWMDARREAWRAYREWCAAPRTQKRSAFIRYRAAADREDAAAVMMQRTAAGEPATGVPASALGVVRALAQLVVR
jgi:hypothetical protein